MSNIISEESFGPEVEKYAGWVLIDFFAEWCGPCRMITPILEEVQKLRPTLKIAKIDVDNAQHLAQRFGVMSIPTLILFKDGKPAQTWVGLRPKTQLLNDLDRAMGQA